MGLNAIKPLAIILVGMPGSGKSTFRREQRLLNPEYKAVSSDDFIEAVAAEKGKTYNECFSAHVKRAEDRMLELVDDYIFEEHSFIWDQTNLTKKKRSKILKIIPASIYDIRCVVFNTEHKRKTKDKKIPLNVLRNMRAGFEHPTEDEGFNMVMEIG